MAASKVIPVYLNTWLHQHMATTHGHHVPPFFQHTRLSTRLNAFKAAHATSAIVLEAITKASCYLLLPSLQKSGWRSVKYMNKDLIKMLVSIKRGGREKKTDGGAL